MKKNSCTPINPKKYSCYSLKRNLITKKNPAAGKFPSPPPITFLMVRPFEQRTPTDSGLFALLASGFCPNVWANGL